MDCVNRTVTPLHHCVFSLCEVGEVFSRGSGLHILQNAKFRAIYFLNAVVDCVKPFCDPSPSDRPLPSAAAGGGHPLLPEGGPQGRRGGGQGAPAPSPRGT